jgi:hypothetical protein
VPPRSKSIHRGATRDGGSLTLVKPNLQPGGAGGSGDEFTLGAASAGRIGGLMAISSVTNREHGEGQVAKAIEQQTAKLPSDVFLWAAVGSMAVSATCQLMGNRDTSVFVGQWAPTFLILGLYNKLVKQLGSEGISHA